MTLGRKLSQYRKVLGLSQQQLGDKLNVSPQAVSKWENNQAEPDLKTLKALAELYHTTTDELLDTTHDNILVSAGAPVQENIDETHEHDSNEKETFPLHPIGFCKRCGITVTEENLGEKEPVVTCKKCLEEIHAEKLNSERKKVVEALNAERERKEKIAKEKARREVVERERKETEARKLRNTQSRIKKFIRLGSIFGGIAALLVLVIFFAVTISNDKFSFGTFIGGVVTTYAVFAFVFLLFFDGVVPDFVLNCFDATVNWPGLIFTFDLEGFAWLIGMKILFAVLGFLIGVLAAVFGIVAGMVLSIFVFPFKVAKIRRNLAIGDDDDLY